MLNPAVSTIDQPQVDWRSEKECFRTVAAAVAFYYSKLPLLPSPPSHLSEGEPSDKERALVEWERGVRNDAESIYWIVE